MSFPPFEIVPPTTLPPDKVRVQRHTPREANDYRAYRACLRWDAGFTCSFCLVHESDLMPNAEGTARTSIEHIEPKVHAPHLINTYSNCAYACRFCNTVRRDTPVQHPSGARLLNPWRDAWGEHFQLREDRLEPLHAGSEGNHARYTERVYRLNDARRVTLRRQRRTFIQDRLHYFARDIAELRHAASRHPVAEDRLRILDELRELEAQRHRAYQELRQRSAVPADAPRTCRCAGQEHCCLPPDTPALRLFMRNPDPV